MRYSLILFLLFISKLTFGQTSITSFPADIPMDDSLNVKLPLIEKSNYSFHFRLLLNGQTVELYSPDKKVFHGEITNTIKQYGYVKNDGEYKSQVKELFTQKVKIDSSKATRLAIDIIKSKQINFPTDSMISSWNKWYLHCGNLDFELKDDKNYIKQSFHCPWSQPDSVEFKDVIISNYNLLKTVLELDSIYNVFFSQLPKGKKYSRDGYRMTYKFTDKETEAWLKDKPRRDYLKSIKDTIDNFLKTELKRLFDISDSTESPCYSASLTFDTNGKLKKIKTDKSDRMKLFDGLSWYIEDIMEDRRCRKSIKRIFKNISLASFNLKHNVYRTFYNDIGNGWTITDDSIY